MSWMGPSSGDEVTVPDLVGMTVADARRAAFDAGLVAAAADPDGPPLGALTWPGVWLVTSQSPAPGSRMRRWGSLVVGFAEVPEAP